MGQHEDAVYLAKLAEQAERYEGPCRFVFPPPPFSTPRAGPPGIDNDVTRRDGGEHEDRSAIRPRAVRGRAEFAVGSVQERHRSPPGVVAYCHVH